MPQLSRVRLAALVVPLLLLVAVAGFATSASAQEPVVHAVLFYDPTCGNCEAVMTEVLPPLHARHGKQLEIVRIDASTIAGFDLWSDGANAYEVPADHRGVPLMFLGDTVFSGEDEIRAGIADAIDSGLAAGGIGLPAVFALTEADVASWHAYAAQDNPAPGPDPFAHALAFTLLAALLAGLAYVLWLMWRSRPWSLDRLTSAATGTHSLLIPILSLGGLGVALYMSWIRYNSSHALCPIGNCDAVQHSPWAVLLGIPIAYWGVLAYGVLLLLWAVARLASNRLSSWAVLGLLALTTFSAAFSVYLTVLELFLIHAVCMWCLLSALIALCLMLVASRGLPATD